MYTNSQPPSRLQQLAAVTITSGMRKDSCEWKAGDFSRALSHSAVQRASRSLWYFTCPKRDGRSAEINLENLWQGSVCASLVFEGTLFLYGLIKVMVVE